jgi:glutamine synthetase adenylyltransferase
MVNMTVEVVDVFEAVTIYELPLVKVKPLIEETKGEANIAAQQSTLLKQITGENDRLAKMTGAGSTQEVAQYIGAVSEALNSVAEDTSSESEQEPDAGKSAKEKEEEAKKDPSSEKREDTNEEEKKDEEVDGENND